MTDHFVRWQVFYRTMAGYGGWKTDEFDNEAEAWNRYHELKKSTYVWEPKPLTVFDLIKRGGQ